MLPQINNEVKSELDEDFVQNQDRQIYSDSFKEWFGDWEKDSEEYTALREAVMDSLGAAAVKEGIKNQNARTAVKSDTEQSGNVQNDDRNNPYKITRDDIKTIQQIGRKSNGRLQEPA